MLRHLHIRNFALISELDLDLYPGLNTITGETGAGKSIILGAIALIMGQRADISSIKQGEDLCVVEATLDVKAYDLEPFFTENDLDYSDEIVVRRQLSSSGKSRAFVNDTPVNLTLLKSLTEALIDVHSQHANLLLQDSGFQMSVLDAFAGTVKLVQTFRQSFSEWQSVVSKIKRLEKARAEALQEQEFMQFQLDELSALQLELGEVESLEQSQRALMHVEEIAHAYGLASAVLERDEEFAVLPRLGSAIEAVHRIADHSIEAKPLADRLDSARIELLDIAREIEAQLEQTESDPEELERVQSRLGEIYHLYRKHNVQTEEDLLRIQSDLEKRLHSIENADDELKALEKKESMLHAALLESADKIRVERKKHAPALAKNIEETLHLLGIEHARFEIAVSSLAQLTPSGGDEVAFRFTANKQSELMPLHRVASGGEMSRVMLSLKSILATKKALPTIIFDEIDTGISGPVATQMGMILEGLGAVMQVVNITHLPQIAARGQHHFLVYKEHSADTSASQIRLLKKDEREQEIARMLSGALVTEAALVNARELLGESNK